MDAIHALIFALKKQLKWLVMIKGFKHSIINQDKCINCNLCKKSCPVLNVEKQQHNSVSYACYNKNDEERINSSSGGIFVLIAKEIINRGGIIFGAAYNDEYVVKHLEVSSIEDLPKLMGSKYVQSIIEDTYVRTKQLLENGKCVLFTGIPCQIEGLKSFLNKDYPKAGDGEYIDKLKEGTIVFGWIHAVQNKDITDKFINNKLTAIAWEDMYENGRHSFWKNNELAGEAAILHAYSLYGKLPNETRVALLGRGNVARGAFRTLVSLGAKVDVYDKRIEQLFRDNIQKYDVIVNSVLWDVKRKDHIIYKRDFKRMKKDSMIIDISCDRGGGIETSIPTTLENPIYYIDNVLHYVVDHTPSILFKSATKAISEQIIKFIDDLILNNRNEIIEKAKIIENGMIKDKRIIEYQKRDM